MAKLRERIKQEQQRRKIRQQRGLPTSSSTLVKLRATQSERDAFTNAHAPILMHIERSIVEHCLDHLDDRVVRDAITSIVHKTPAPSNPVQTLVQQLGQAYKETGCSEEVWQDGLRVVYRSLSTTSKCRSGEITYILHAAQFLGIT